MVWCFAEGRCQVIDSFGFCPRISLLASVVQKDFSNKKNSERETRMTHIETHFVLQASVHFYQKRTVSSTKLQKVIHFKFYTNLFNCLWFLTFGQMAEQRDTTKLTGEFSNFSFRKTSLKDTCTNFSISCRQKLFFLFASVYASWHWSKRVV